MRKNRRNHRKRKGYTSKIIVVLLLTVIGVYSVNKLFVVQQSEEINQPTLLTMLLPVSTQDSLPLIEQPAVRYEIETDLDINGTNALLLRFDGSNGSEILYEKNASIRTYPASLTKIMTALVVIENIKNFEEKVILNEKMYSYLEKENASVAGFVKNEEVSIIDLLYGVMLPSGAECCIGLAEYISNSEAGFVKLMNDKARELGMNDTHFVNTTGLHNDDHYSTVRDIAALLEYALNNTIFYKIFTTQSYLSKPTNIHENGITFSSTMFWLMKRIGNIENSEFDGGKILGGKTGYTDEAGQCLASLAEKDGERFMFIICGAKGDYRTQTLHIDDAFYVYNSIDYKFVM